ncbi:MAG: bifunctional phosphoglucose/phosphomannose isomerase [Ignavibacteria bacterium]|nr:bifunctional phosphoglucose/phosphomannose isomerase [Ignavibacteria bacterium]
METIDYPRKIAQNDPTGQFANLAGFPSQANVGLAAAADADLLPLAGKTFSSLVIIGMGGSAIGGDILRSWASAQSRIPILVNRGYRLPGFVGPTSLVVALSYSGMTEETLSGYADARARGASIIAVTTGGELQLRAVADGVPVVSIPAGLAPRFALGYLFFALLGVARRLDLVTVGTDELREAIACLERKAVDLARPGDTSNEAIAIAERLHGMLPVLYSGTELLEGVAVRWRCQVEENAKALAYSSVLPELNHNEIVGWERNPDLLKRIAVIMLRDPSDSMEVSLRFDVTRDLIRAAAGDIIEIRSAAVSPLARVLELVCLGDWVSYYLAVGTDTDPYPIEKINALKSALAQHRVPPVAG